MKQCVIGVDFGTDSVRAVITDCSNGSELGSAVHHYSRWKKGLYCDPASNRFRQHPLDYLEGLEASIVGALSNAPSGTAEKVLAISVDTTGSTPVAVDAHGHPLSLQSEFADDPDAMFVLWKDHTAIAEAAEINRKSREWKGMDYLKYSGGIYSSEWFWAKIMKISRGNPRVRESAATWIEHCDWIPAVLAGIDDVDAIPRGRCAWGHKAMWHASWGGLPPADFLEYLDPYLGRVRAASPSDTWTAEKKVGDLCPEWARRLGLPRNVVIGGGAFDCHMGAVGAGIKPGWLVKVIGTSTCDIMIAPRDRIGDRQVRGICGQVDGSVVPGWIGLEAGQSAFGDLYAWFKDILLWPARNLGPAGAALESMEEKIMPALVEAAAAAPLSADGPIAVDWINGRRTPDANQGLKGALMGLAIGHDAPRLFRAVIEASAFGAKAIADRIREEGVPIEGILAIGGVARKAPFAMQVLADVMDSPIQVAASDQACALGASIFAAVAGGAYPDVPAAQAKMATSAERSYHPDKERAEVYRVLFRRYEAAGAFIESSAKEEGA